MVNTAKQITVITTHIQCGLAVKSEIYQI